MVVSILEVSKEVPQNRWACNQVTTYRLTTSIVLMDVEIRLQL
jgi:hypothetical protein